MRKEGRVGRTRGEMGCTDVGMIKALENPHLTPHSLFAGTAFNATSRMKSTARVIIAAWVREEDRLAKEDLEEGNIEKLAVLQRSVKIHCSGSTCHIVCCQNNVMTMSVSGGVDIKCIA
jgi:hypothetical protein